MLHIGKISKGYSSFKSWGGGWPEDFLEKWERGGSKIWKALQWRINGNSESGYTEYTYLYFSLKSNKTMQIIAKLMMASWKRFHEGGCRNGCARMHTCRLDNMFLDAELWNAAKYKWNTSKQSYESHQCQDFPQARWPPTNIHFQAGQVLNKFNIASKSKFGMRDLKVEWEI